jgi:hypothetical protein
MTAMCALNFYQYDKVHLYQDKYPLLLQQNSTLQVCGINIAVDSNGIRE